MASTNLNGRAITQIMQNLRERGRDIEQAAKRALREEVSNIVQTAKLNCPVDTGKLRDSVHEEEENNGLTYKIVADAKNAQGVPYGKFVEYGLANHPFLYPAIEQYKDGLSRKIKDAMHRAI